MFTLNKIFGIENHECINSAIPFWEHLKKELKAELIQEMLKNHNSIMW